MPNKMQLAAQRMAKGLFGITFGTPGADTWQESHNFSHGLPIGMGTGSRIQQPYAQSGTLSLAISRVAGDAASVPWELFQTDSRGVPSDEPVEGHALIEAFKRPNAYMNGRQFWTGSYISKLLWGERFWYFPDLVVRSSSAPSSMRSASGTIELLDPRAVKNRVENGVMQWYLVVNGVDQPLDPEKLCHSKMWNPYNVWRGLPIIASIMAEIDGDFAAAQWNERFFNDQNGIPSGVLIPGTGTVMDKDQRDDMRRTWSQRHSGTKRSIGILPSGWTFQDLGISQRDMDWTGLREYSREQILARVGVPPFLAGVLDKANYANAREQKEVYWQHTIHDFITDEQSNLNDDLLPKLGIDGVAIFPNWEAVKALLENLTEKSDVAEKWFRLGLSKRVINDRLEMGWNEEDIADYETGYLPMNLMPSEMMSDPETFAPPEPAPPADEPPADDDEESEDGEKRNRKGDAAVEMRRTLVWRNIVTRTRDLEIEFARKVRSHFKALNVEVLDNLTNLEASYGVSRIAQVVKDKETFVLWDQAKADANIRRVTKATYKSAIKRGGSSVFADLGLSVSFDLTDPRVVAKLAALVKKIDSINETVYLDLLDSLADGLADSETLEQLAKRVNHQFGIARTRSKTIARTEMAKAFNGARLDGMEQAGIEQHEWLSSRDSDVRDDHIHLDGEVVNVGDEFGFGMEYPGDPAGGPEQVINCRCVSVPVKE